MKDINLLYTIITIIGSFLFGIWFLGFILKKMISGYMDNLTNTLNKYGLAIDELIKSNLALSAKIQLTEKDIGVQGKQLEALDQYRYKAEKAYDSAKRCHQRIDKFQDSFKELETKLTKIQTLMENE